MPTTVARGSPGSRRPVHFSAIYKRDVISFLPRRQIESLRMVSRSLYTMIENMDEAKLPRVRFDMLEINGNWPALPDDFTLDGFPVEKTSYGWTSSSMQWDELSEFGDCCREILEEKSRELTGQLVFIDLHRPRNRVDVVRVTLSKTGGRGEKQICLTVLNRLTERSAFELLHFLSHLHGCAMETLHIDAPHGGGGGHSAMINPLVLGALSSISGEAYRLFAGQLLSLEVRADNTLIWCAAQMATFECVTSDIFPHAESMDGGEAAYLILNVGANCRQAKFTYSDLHGEVIPMRLVDETVQPLCTAESFDLVIDNALIAFDLYSKWPVLNEHTGQWPQCCNRAHLIRRKEVSLDETEREWLFKRELLVYRFFNAPTGREFLMEMSRIVACPDRTPEPAQELVWYLESFKLTFH